MFAYILAIVHILLVVVVINHKYKSVATIGTAMMKRNGYVMNTEVIISNIMIFERIKNSRIIRLVTVLNMKFLNIIGESNQRLYEEINVLKIVSYIPTPPCQFNIQ